MDYLRYSLLKTILLLIFIFGCTQVFSQPSQSGTKPNNHPLYISINYGITQYYGNINPGTSPFKDFSKRTATAYGISLEQRITPWLSISGDAYWGSLKSKRDTTDITREYSFDADYLEQSVSFNLSPLAFFEDRPQKWDLFFSVGLGLAHFKGQTITVSSGKIFYEFGDAGKGIGKRQLEGIFIAGGGFKYHINSRFDIILNIKYKVLNIPDLDGFEKYNNHSAYSFFGLGIAYRPSFKLNKRKSKIIDYEVKEVHNYEPFIEDDTAFVNQRTRDSLNAIALQPKVEINRDSTDEITKQNTLVRMGFFPEAIYYNSNSAEIGENEVLKIDKLMGILKNNSSLRVMVMAYAETDGTEVNPTALCKKRAEIVAKIMKDFYFLTPDRIILEYTNERNPEFDKLFKSYKRVIFKPITK
jgi:outer membrane protein OmpA-like peptidoglycan-associated protein